MIILNFPIPNILKLTVNSTISYFLALKSSLYFYKKKYAKILRSGEFFWDCGIYQKSKCVLTEHDPGAHFPDKVTQHQRCGQTTEADDQRVQVDVVVGSVHVFDAGAVVGAGVQNHPHHVAHTRHHHVLTVQCGVRAEALQQLGEPQHQCVVAENKYKNHQKCIL